MVKMKKECKTTLCAVVASLFVAGSSVAEDPYKDYITSIRPSASELLKPEKKRVVKDFQLGVHLHQNY